MNAVNYFVKLIEKGYEVTNNLPIQKGDVKSIIKLAHYYDSKENYSKMMKYYLLTLNSDE